MTVASKQRVGIWTKLCEELIDPGILDYVTRRPDRHWFQSWMSGVLYGWTEDTPGYVSDVFAEQILWIARINSELNANGSTAVELMFDMFDEHVLDKRVLENVDEQRRIRHILEVLQRVFPPENDPMSLFEQFMQETRAWVIHTQFNAYSMMEMCYEAKPLFDYIEAPDDYEDPQPMLISNLVRDRVYKFLNPDGVSPATEEQLRRYRRLLIKGC